MLNKFLYTLLFSLISMMSYSQESEVNINHEGKDFTMLKHAWTAQWITTANESTLDYGVFLFRKDFDIKKTYNEFIIYVSADNIFKLYVNGEFIIDGPARGDINNWRYEKIDISKYLKIGKNVIAAEVVNFGEFRKGAQQTFQTAFILQSKNEDDIDLNTNSESGWKVIKNKAYTCIPFVSDSLGGYYVAGPGDRINFSKFPNEWNKIDYDDSNWQKPRNATVEFAVGRGFLFGSTWFLVPNELPKMTASQSNFQKVISVSGIDDAGNLLDNKKLIIPANANVSILMDFGVHSVGFPKLNFNAGNNSEIKITYAEALFYKDSHERSAHKGWEKGYRNDFSDDKEIRGYYDILYPDGNYHEFKSISLRTFRFVQLDIKTNESALVIDSFLQIESHYPFNDVGTFYCDNEKINKIREVSWRTFVNSSHDVFLDPYYEQLQYVGDSRIESIVSIYASGDDRLMKNAIKSFDNSRLPIGLTQSRYPSYIVQVIPPYSLFWIGMIHDFMLYRNDTEYVKQFFTGIDSVLKWFLDRVDEEGKLSGLEWWNFTDWTSGFQNGIPPGADNGVSANISLQLVKGLQDASEIYSYFGDKKLSEYYKSKSKLIQKYIMDNFYDKSRGLIAEEMDKKVFSQHTNIFAILTNTYHPEDFTNVMNHILSDSDLIQTSIYFKYYLFRALQKSHMGNLYLNMLQPWQNMLDNGMTTFGETDDNPRSDCHAWSASPCFDLLHTVAGIYPTSFGFNDIIIEPNPGDLKFISAKVPHPNGIINCDFTFKGNEVTAEINLPDNVNGFFIWEGTKVKLKSGFQKIIL
ncbi:MAG: alpha-L-rhamnosidase C-terminal domain-containing protein [Saprospiraceae bacterium]